MPGSGRDPVVVIAHERRADANGGPSRRFRFWMLLFWGVSLLAPARAQGGSLRTYSNMTGGRQQSANQTQSASVQTFLVPDDQTDLQGCFEIAAPRKAFHFVVPPGGTITVALEHPRKALLQLTKATLAEWTGKQPSPWQKLIPLNAKIQHTNREKVPQEVIYLVTDPEEVSSQASPYKLVISRSWVVAPVKPSPSAP
jgi:hypothetical protein